MKNTKIAITTNEIANKTKKTIMNDGFALSSKNPNIPHTIVPSIGTHVPVYNKIASIAHIVFIILLKPRNPSNK